MGTGELHPFEPDWTMSPGALLRAELAERDVSEAHFADLAGLGAETVHGLLAGTVRVDGMIAARIARVIGTSGSMWLNAQTIYDDALARGAKDLSEELGRDGNVA